MKNEEIIAVLKRLLPQAAVLLKVTIEKPTEEILVEEGFEKVLNLNFFIQGHKSETYRLQQPIDDDWGTKEYFKIITDFSWTVSKMCRDKLMMTFIDGDLNKVIEENEH